MKLYHTLFGVLAIINLSACVTLGTEDVNAENYQGFNLGASPLSQKPADLTERKNTQAELSEKEHSNASYVTLEPLPSVTEADFSKSLSQIPQFADDSKLLTISVNEMPVVDFIHHVYGDLLNLDYAFSPDVEKMRNQLVLRLQQPVTPKELYKLATSLLEGNQISIASKDNLLYFQRLNKSDKGGKPVGIGAAVEEIPNVAGNIVQLIPYTYNSSGTIQRIATKLTNASLYAFDDQKLIVAEGSYDELVRVVQLVEMLDVPAARGRDIRFLSMTYISPDEALALLTELLTQEGLRVGNSGDVAFVPIARQNALIVYSTSSTLGDRVVSWVSHLDKPEEGEKARFFIYRPKFSKSEDIYKSLSGLISGAGSSSEGESSSKASVKSRGEASKAPGKNSTNSSIIQNDRFKVSVDEVQNSLLIQATPMQYRELLSLLEQLDQVPPQVALDVAIAEFDITDNFSAGISRILIDSSATTDLNQGIMSILPASGSLGIEAIVGKAEIDFSLIGEKSKSRVLSRPYLVVQDGESASISSGRQVPIQTGTSTTDGGTTTEQIQYRSTGVNLTVTPTINAEGLISLEIQQSVSNSEPGGGLTPTITDRSLTTSVLIGNSQTAILGGLIQNNDANSGAAVPWLSAIPLLGNLFKYKSDSFSRSELVIMITPKILKNPEDLSDFSDSIKDLFSLKLGAQPNEQVEDSNKSPND